MTTSASRPVRLLYFAWVREKAGMATEEVALPPAVRDIDGLIDWLRARGGGPAEALSNLSRLRVAVNQEHVAFDHPIGPGDEVAFFPPVTGG